MHDMSTSVLNARPSNRLILDGKIFRNSNIKESQSSKAPAIFAPNASTTTRVTRSSTATAKDRSSSAFVVKAPSQHSSDSDSSSETVSLGSTQKVKTRYYIVNCSMTILTRVTFSHNCIMGNPWRAQATPLNLLLQKQQ